MSGEKRQLWQVVEDCLKEDLFPKSLRWHPDEPNVFLVSRKRLNQSDWTQDDVRHCLYWDTVAGRKIKDANKYISEIWHRYLRNLDRMVALGELQPVPELDSDGLEAYRIISEGSSPESTCAESDAGSFSQNTGPVGAETEGNDLMTLAKQLSGIFAPDANGDLSLDAQGKIQPRHVFADGEPAVATSSHHSRQQISSLPEHGKVTVGTQTKKGLATLQFLEETLVPQETSSPSDINMSSEEETSDKSMESLDERSDTSPMDWQAISSSEDSSAPELSNEGACVTTNDGNSSQDVPKDTLGEMSDTYMDWQSISSFENAFAPELSNEGALHLPTNKTKNSDQVFNDDGNDSEENGCQNTVYDVPRSSPPSFKNMKTVYPNTVFKFDPPNVTKDSKYELINNTEAKPGLDLWYETRFDLSQVPHRLENVTGEENTVDVQGELDKQAGDDVRRDTLDKSDTFLDSD